MVHTRDGSRLVREFIVRGSAKVIRADNNTVRRSFYPVYQDRKQIVKAIKPYVERMSQEEFAQLVLFSAFDIIE